MPASNTLPARPSLDRDEVTDLVSKVSGVEGRAGKKSWGTRKGKEMEDGRDSWRPPKMEERGVV